MQLFKKIANVFLAVLLMVATTGVTLNKHYCLGQLKSISIFHEAKSCMTEMDMEEESCPLDCCDNTSEQYKLEEFKQVSFEDSFAPDLKLIAVISYFLANSDLTHAPASNTPNPHYLPPLIDQDIPVMVQSFLL